MLFAWTMTGFRKLSGSSIMKGEPITGNDVLLSLKIVPNWLLPLKRVQP